MDQPIDHRKIRRRRLRRWGNVALIVGAVFLAFIGLRALLKPSAASRDFRFATVERGDLENTISASGLVTPSFEQQINAPIATEIEEVLLRSGATVGAGDLIMRLNREFIQLDLNSRRSQLALSENSIDLLQLELERDLKELEYDDQIKGLQVAAAEARLADAQRLQQIGGATAEEVEQAQTQLDILLLEKRKLENELAFRRGSLAGRVREVELEADIEEQEVAELERKLGLTEVRAPGPGVITWVNESIGEQVVEGSPLARVADLRSFHVEASCSDRYADQIKLGLPVKVRLNDRDLPGQITNILPAVANNTVEFIVALEKPDDAQLRPNMRLEVYVITGRKEDALRVRRGPTFSGAVRQDVFVLRGDQAVKTDIRIGTGNGEFVEIVEGNLREGDRIIISDMEDYEHLETIQMN